MSTTTATLGLIKNVDGDNARTIITTDESANMDKLESVLTGADVVKIPAAALAAEAWTAFTPVLDQGGIVASSVYVARYKKLGRLVVMQISLSAQAVGTAASPITIGGIPAALSLGTGEYMVGSFRFTGTPACVGVVTLYDDMNLRFYRDNQSSRMGISDVTLAGGNLLEAVLSYEAYA